MTRHTEAHFTGGEIVRDAVIGMADGLTVPFALAAGLTGAISQTHVIVAAGFAEIAAGAIAMGLGGFLAAPATPSILRANNGGRSARSRSHRMPRRRRFARSSSATDSRATRSPA